MAEHMLEWLNAYLDGELSGWKRERVEQHLAACPTCRHELEVLRFLSQEIQQVSLPQELPSAERFTAQVILRLPRQTEQPARRTGRELSWWLAPAALLVAWAFVQAVFWLSNGVWAAAQAGLLGEARGWLAPASQGAGILTGAFQWLGVIPGDTPQQIAGLSESIGWNLLLQMGIEGGVALLYLGWLVAWWQRQQQRTAGLVPARDLKNGL
jgi:predicted anti-sigma-YlaC factor YlaD